MFLVWVLDDWQDLKPSLNMPFEQTKLIGGKFSAKIIYFKPFFLRKNFVPGVEIVSYACGYARNQ